jgi:hypothetical protein
VSNQGTYTKSGGRVDFGTQLLKVPPKLPTLTPAQIAQISANPPPIGTDLTANRTWVIQNNEYYNTHLNRLDLTKKTPLQTKPSIQFPAGANIHDCIAAILRDCQLIRENLAKVAQGSGSGLDSDDNFDYFYISIKSVPTGEYDEINNQPKLIQRYLILPYKIHISRLPGYQNKTINADKLKKRIRRSYNYLYTGKNTEVLNFNLKYNNLFFQSRPINQGKNPDLDGRVGAYQSPNEKTNDEPVKKDKVKNKKTVQLNPPTLTNIKTIEKTPGYDTRPFSSDPWTIAAQNVHRALLDEVAMILVDIDIVGDPYYLIQGGIGNIVSVPLKLNGNTYSGLTETGDADHQNSDVYVNVDVNSITDMSVKTGLAINNKAAEFSGIYRLTEIVSNFQGGAFTQKLKMLRLPSQPSDVTDLSKG